MDRRGFLGNVAWAGAAFAAGHFLPWHVSSDPPPSRLVVARGKAAEAVKLAIEALGGIGSFVKPGDRVLLKPNASFPNPPAWGCNTSPEVVTAVTRICLEAGAKRVLVVDNTLGNPELCFSRSGIKAALEGIHGVHLLAPKDKDLYREIEVPRGRALRKTRVMREVLESECWISLPTAKSHSATGVSLGLKGLMGLVWDRGIFHRDLDLDQAIADLATILRPTLTVMDATRALLTAGPGGPGQVERWDKIVAGVDPVAVDAYTVTLGTWYGQKVRPEQVKHLRAARDLGLGISDPAKMEIVEKGA
ncbi:MAG: DUF362 domain-containing protein [Thermodesulfobacteriota bacterium]